MSRSLFPESDESQSERFKRKAKEAPFVVAGITGLMGIVGWRLWNFRKRDVKASVYLIHMRMYAQGFVVTCLTLGIGWNLINEHILKKKEVDK